MSRVGGVFVRRRRSRWGIVGGWTAVAFLWSGGVAARFRRGRWRRAGIEWLGAVLVHWVCIRHRVVAYTDEIWLLEVLVKPYR